MRKKLEGNGMWESSRMMLPEHKSAHLRQQDDLRKRQRVYLDDQELEQIGRRLIESLNKRTIVEVRMYDPREQLRVVGIVDRIDRQRGRFLVNGDWFILGDIEGVEDAG